MCGVYGFITNKRDYDKKYRLFKELALATQVRGRHATGFAYSDGKHEKYFKHGETADLFVQRPQFQGIAEDKPYMIIGHDRWATHGKPEDNRNNHPFKSRALQFIHNGVISNFDSLKAEYPVYSECDSEIILRMIERAPRRITGIQNIYKEVRGSFACALMDTRALRLWLWRNYGNPIYLNYHTGLGIFLFCSTYEIFKTATKASELEHGWTKGYYWGDDYVLCVKYRPEDDKILRSTVEVEHQQIDPMSVQHWSDETLTKYSRYYTKRNRHGKGKTVETDEEGHYRRGVWDNENKCWVF